MIKAVDCMTQHIKTFHSQALDEVTADYGEPCQTCPYVKGCSYDWLSIMEPLLAKSNVKISMVRQVLPDKQDSDDKHPD